MSWWLGYGVTRAVSDLVRGELAGTSRRDGDYLLPDERARQAACTRLAAVPGLADSEIEVSVLSGVLKLTGSVRSAELKSRARQVCADINGVSEVEDELVIA